ncbi:MAG: DUF3179 domain-containing protein [Candidatus Harrisonbacteria bacterium]|nr:DUF3179 domain-containing protein [Candidatus Harrisonbacteria bacterium]
MLKFLIPIVIGAVVLVGGYFLINQLRQYQLPKGDTKRLAPDFTLRDFDGKDVSLADFRGRPIMIDFWAAWCVFCETEFPEIQKAYESYKDRGLIVIGIHRTETENPDIGLRFAERLGIKFVLLKDETGEIYQKYGQGVQAMPMSFFVDKDNIIQETIFGPKDREKIIAGLKKIIVDYPVTTGEGDEEPVISEREIFVTDGSKHSIPLEEILSGGPPKDGIPSIDKPKFVSVKEASDFLKEDRLGLAVNYKGINRFYPYQILVWHEIVNDIIAGDPILATYCPLCGTGIVFSREINGEAVEFGVSGLLHNNNLLMYDRKTDSLWSQVLGEAVVGELTGRKLQIIPSANVLWSDWKKQNPGGEVLSRDTGFIRDYDYDPYGGYYSDRSIYFPVDVEDDRLHPKTIVIGIIVNKIAKAYPSKEVINEKVVNDKIGGIDIKIEFNETTKEILVKDINGRSIDKIEAFWFSWVNAYPDTLLWKP